MADGQNVGVRRNDPTSDSEWVSKPMGYSLFKHELAPTPIHWVEKKGNMVWSKYHEEVRAKTTSSAHSLHSP